jgi:hypothetical protein
MIEVFSSGGGTQSAAITALIVQGRLPKPDFCLIADTGHEVQSTWDYWHAIIEPELASVGVKAERIPLDFKIIPEHGKDWLSHNRNTVLLPLYTDQSGDYGKLSGFCSARWKVEVVNRYLSRVYGLTRSKFRKWIGFSFDESKRINRMMQGEEYKRGLIRFPLADGLAIKRDQAIQLVRDMGWPEPPRSRCYMCPNQSNREWHDVQRNYPEQFQEALQIEREIRSVDPHAYFHGSFTPLYRVDFSDDEDMFSGYAGCSDGVCFL